MSDMPEAIYDWEESVYGKVSEVVPADAPEPLGKHVVAASCRGANLCHNILSGRSVTGMLHLVNKTVRLAL